MLPHRLFELAIATAMSGKNVLAALSGELRLREPSKNKLRKQCVRALQEDLDNDHPRRFRETDLDTVCDLVWPGKIFGNADSPVMAHVFAMLMERDGPVVRYAPSQVEDYANFAGRFDPACLVAWHLAREIKESELTDRGAIRAMVEAQQPFFSARADDTEQYTDGHVHLNGLHFDGVILMNQIWPKQHAVPGATRDIATLSAITHLLAAAPCLSLGERPDHLHGPKAEVALRARIAPLLAETMCGNPPKVEWSWLAEEEREPAEFGWHWLRWQIADAISRQELARAWLWFHLFLWWQYQHRFATATLRICIYYLQGSLMRVRRELIMDGVGLARFKALSNSTLRRSAGEANGLANARLLLQGKADCAEIKVGPDVFDGARIRQFVGTLYNVRGLERALEDGTAEGVDALRRLSDQWSLCIHFSRNADDYRETERGALWDSADELVRKMDASADWLARDVLAYPGEQIGFVPANWIRGFDVVGDENVCRIEVYAPVLRWLRSDRAAIDKDERGKLPHPREPDRRRYLSIHAGEDYAHPLSGMRHVDETVQFCELGEADRLGHALALGIEPRVWCVRQGDMLLGISEHLDNLVWAWHYAVEIGKLEPHVAPPETAELARKAAERLKQRIGAVAEHVSWARDEPRDDGLASALHQAWRYRKNCPIQLQKYKEAKIPDPKIVAAVPDRDALLPKPDASGSGGQDRTDDAKRARRAFDNRNKERLAANTQEITVLVRPGGAGKLLFNERLKLYTDHDSDIELEFMHVLQDYLLDEYRKQGIVIETNPTSNLYIARLASYREHPIYRWAPADATLLAPGKRYNLYGLRHGPMAVTINTDDPGIMPTTLRTEFLLIAEAGGLSSQERGPGEWLDTIRERANTLFRDNRVSVWAGTAPEAP